MGSEWGPFFLCGQNIEYLLIATCETLKRWEYGRLPRDLLLTMKGPIRSEFSLGHITENLQLMVSQISPNSSLPWPLPVPLFRCLSLSLPLCSYLALSKSPPSCERHSLGYLPLVDVGGQGSIKSLQGPAAILMARCLPV